MGTPHKSTSGPFQGPISSYANYQRPFVGPQLKTPTNHKSVYSDQWHNRLNLHKKRPPSRPSFIQRSHQVESMSRRATGPDCQEGRNYARLPGHDASWTRHHTGSRTLFPAALLSPATAPSSATTTHRGPPIRQARQPCSPASRLQYAARLFQLRLQSSQQTCYRATFRLSSGGLHHHFRHLCRQATHCTTRLRTINIVIVGVL